MTDIPPLRQPCGGPSLAALRRYDTGELAAADRAATRAHLDGCPSCGAVLADFAAERAAVAQVMPFAAFEARLAPRRAPVATWLKRLGLALALPAFGAAAAMLLMAKPPDDDGGTRLKGGALSYLVKTANGSRLGSEREPLRAGDVIRLRYVNELRRPYVLIVGVDADAKVFPYLANGDRSSSAQPGLNLVQNSVTLDADRRPERVFALFSNEPIAIDEVKPVARDALLAAHGDVTKLTTLALPKVESATVLLTKAAP